jgi:hypothetical protein
VVTVPPGIDENYLINPEYVTDRGWGLCCIPDRLAFDQIRILIEHARSPDVYGLFGMGANRLTVMLTATVEAISEFFVKMVGGDVCVFDLPVSFLVSVLEGDLTLIATGCPDLQTICGKTDMSRCDWIEIAKGLRPDISAKILAKYVDASNQT